MSKLTNGVEFRVDENFEESVRRALRDAYVAGVEAAETRSLFTAGQWADREVTDAAFTLRRLAART